MSFFTIFLLLHLPLTATSSIHNLLESQGLPAGLFPDSVKSYSLDQNGLLEVHLDQPCLAKFETRVHFDSVIRANLSFGGLKGLEGLSQEELFLWLPVKDIIVNDPSSGLILFDIGVAHKQLSLSLFEDPPVCKPQGTKIFSDFFFFFFAGFLNCYLILDLGKTVSGSVNLFLPLALLLCLVAEKPDRKIMENCVFVLLIKQPD